MHIQLVTLTTKPEAQSEMAALLRSHVVASNAEDGVMEMRIHFETDMPHRFWAYERYQDDAALAAHMQTGHTRRLLEMAQTSLDQPPEVMTLKPLTPMQDASEHVAGSIPMFFVFPVHLDARTQLLKALDPYVHQTRLEPGNLRFDVYEIEGDAEHIAIFEIWQDDVAFQAHLQQPYAKEINRIFASAIPGDVQDYLVETTDL